jgi:DNA-binding beta-propeller fold protein YncE
MTILLPLALAGFACLDQQGPPPAPPAAPPAAQPAGPYRVQRTFHVGGDGAWGSLAIDSKARRLYVTRATRVQVLDADTGAEVGVLADTPGVHAVALAPALGRVFASDSKADTATVFDLEKRTSIATVKTGKRPHGLVYDAALQRVYIANPGGESVTVVAADSLAVVGTVALGGKPEALATDADGRVFASVEDTNEIVVIDPAKLAVDRRIGLAPGKGPAGLAIDAEHHRLFAICHNAQMVVLDSKSGAVLARPAIGKRGYVVAFDADLGRVLTANSDGTLTVIATKGDPAFTVVQTLTTAAGANTLALDPSTHRVYLPTAEFEGATAEGEHAEGSARRRPAAKPGSFGILVVGT